MRSHEHHVGILGKARDDVGEIGGRYVTVGVEERQKLIPIEELEVFDRAAKPTQFSKLAIACEEMHAGKLLDDSGRVIGRSVVGDVNVRGGDPRGDQAFEAATDEQLLVVGRNDHAEARKPGGRIWASR